MSNYSDAAAGLKTVIEANISNFIVYDYPEDKPVPPCVVILPGDVDYQQAMAGDTFRAEFRLVVLVASADDRSGWLRLYDMIDPTDTGSSIKRAIGVDPSLDGKVDSSQVLRMENAGRREINNGFFYGFDLIVDFIKTA